MKTSLKLSTLLVSVISAVVVLFGGQAASAASPTKVNIQSLPASGSNKNLSINYQVITVNVDYDFDVVLKQNGSTVGSPQSLTGDFGGSGIFNVSLGADGNYSFQVVATIDGGPDSGTEFSSATTNYQLDTSVPGAPVVNGVTQSGNSHSVTFTIPAGSDIKTIDFFASTTASFKVSNANKIGTINATPGQQQTFTYNAPDSQKRYFAAVGYDSAGNATAPVTKQEVQSVGTSSTSTSSPSRAAALLAGAAALAAQDENGDHDHDENSGANSTEDSEEGPNSWWYVLAALLVVGFGIYAFQRSRAGKDEA